MCTFNDQRAMTNIMNEKQQWVRRVLGGLSMAVLAGCIEPTEKITESVPKTDPKFRAGVTAFERDLYLDLLQRSLTDLIYENDPEARKARQDGRDWPSRAYTMIGMKRLNNLRFCIEKVLEQDIPGDFIEAGAWRGGATIYMRAILKSHQVTDRTVWVADSFEGLPSPDAENYPVDENAKLHEYEELAVSVEQVQSNFDRYGLLDNQVQFLKGWFKDTLPDAPIEKLAILRIDADLYESTMQALENLYPKLSPGGYVIIDDYVFYERCRIAVNDYRREHGIEEEVKNIDWSGVYWRKPLVITENDSTEKMP